MSNQESIVILDGESLGDDLDLSPLEKIGTVTRYDRTGPEQTLERIQNHSIVISNKVILGPGELQSSPALKLICIAATGTNNVDLPLARSFNIAVTNVAGYSTSSVVQHTFAMLFQIQENLGPYDDFVKRGFYSMHGLFTKFHPFHDLSELKWGIVGLGNIGRQVGRVAREFGASVSYSSLSGSSREEEFPRMELDELLNTSDIVSIHAPLNQHSAGRFDYETICKMKPDAILMNLGRGGIIVESDLARALDGKRIKGACIDVFEQEPPPADNPLFSLNEPHRILFTPHIAWASVQARKRLLNEIVLNIDSFLKGERRNRVD